jgi:cell division protein FtsB
VSRLLRKALRVAPFVFLGAIVLAAASRDSGIPAWLRLDADHREAERRIAAMSRSLADLESRAAALRDSEFELERAIRNDLRLARPGEVVVIVPSEEPGILSIP